MSLLARILSVRADINTTVLESIRQCVLLQVRERKRERDRDCCY